MDEKIPVLLDTDIGCNVDDAACLAYLLGEPRCELAGITTVGGKAQVRTQLADAVSRAAGREDIPIASGTQRPMLTPERRTEVPQAKVLADWPHPKDFEPFAAVNFMRRIIRNRPGELTLVTIGPLTNVGILFAMDEEIPSLLKGLSIMGGAYFNANCAETNMRGDPHAAEIVLSNSPENTRIYGLDATRECQKPAAECRELFHGGALDIIGEMAEVFFSQRSAITFHDPLAAACVFRPHLCTYRRGTASVDLTGEGQPGETSFEEDPDGPHQVAEKSDPNKFFTHYFSAIGNLRT